MYKLAYVIPTKNRPKCLDECLDAMSNSFLKYDVAVYIMDGSEDDSSLRVFEKYKSENIFYSKMPELNGDERSVFGINVADSEYVCLSADAHIPSPENTEYVMHLLDKGYDLLEFSPRDYKHIGLKEYINIVEMFADCAWDSTMAGTVFVKKSSYGTMDYAELLHKYIYDGFIHIIYYYDFFKKDSFKGIYCPKVLYTVSKYKGASSWYSKESFLEIWDKEWVGSISRLSSKFDQYKKQVILDHGVYGLGLAYVCSWLKYKSDGLLDEKIFEKYENEIKQITTVNIKYVRWICRIPDVFRPLCGMIQFIFFSIAEAVPVKWRKIIKRLIQK